MSETAVRSPRADYLGLLRRQPDFRRVYVAQLISLGGDWFAIIPLLTLLLRLTGGGLWGGLVLAADVAAFALLSPVAGALVDRLDRRRIMIAADLASAALVLLLLLVRSSGTAWLALVAIGGVAVAKAFFTPASTAAVPNLVDREDLAAANVLAGASWGTMLAVGAAAGGALAAVVGERWCFGIDAASFVVSALLVWRTRRPFQEARPPREHPSVRRAVPETFRYAGADLRVASLLACKLGPGLGNGALALFPLFAAQVFRVGAVGTGLLFSARGLGALIGPFVARRWVSRDPGLLWPALGVSMALFGVCYIVFAVTPFFPLALVVVTLAHMGGGANWIMSTYALQVIVPDQMRGRVFSVDFMIAMVGVGLSQVLTGVLSERVDVRVLSAALGTVVICYAGGWSVVSARLRNGRPASGAAELGDEAEGVRPSHDEPVGSAPAQRA